MDPFECPFSAHSKSDPNAPALLASEGEWSYLECEKWVQGTAWSLYRAGIREGHSVALLPTKAFPTPLLLFALFRIGAICSLIPPSYPLTTLPQWMQAFRTSFLIHPDDVALPKIEGSSLSFSSILQKGSPGSRTFLNKAALATYLLTSGTTGVAKIACHTLGNHYYSALGSQPFLPIKKGDIYHLSLPLHHIAGVALLFRTFLGGGAVALGHTVRRLTHLSLVPTQLKRLLEQKEIPCHYKHILLGGAPISPLLYERARQRGLPVHPTYGMTEMSSQIATHFNLKTFSLGHSLPYREFKIGREGNILVRGKTLFKGYLTPSGSFELPLNEEGYFETNDLGTYCPTVGLQLLGRKDRLFISGGENIHPEEIEKHLLNLEGIRRVQVMPIPDEEYGFRPKAWIESDTPYRREELEHFLAQFLPKFKIPVTFNDFDPKEII